MGNCVESAILRHRYKDRHNAGRNGRTNFERFAIHIEATDLRQSAVCGTNGRRCFDSSRFLQRRKVSIPFTVLFSKSSIVLAFRVVPIFTLSSVTGENLEQLEKFLNVLPRPQTQRERDEQLQDEPVFEIDEIFNVSHVGSVCYGLLAKGMIREGDELLVGPDPLGEFKPVVIESLQRNRTPCRLIQAGQAASLAIGDFSAFQLRKVSNLWELALGGSCYSPASAASGLALCSQTCLILWVHSSV